MSMWARDKLSAEIMRELWGSPFKWNSRKTHREVASKLGIDEETLRLRLRHMRESSYLQGWRLLPNPAQLHRESSFILLEYKSAEAREHALPNLKHTNGVLVIAVLYEKRAVVTILHEGEPGLSKIIAKIERDTGGKTLKALRMPFPPLAQRLQKTDWAIALQLLRNAEVKPEVVAHKVRISPRSVRRRLEKMMTTYSLYTLPLVNLQKMEGVPYHLLVECEETKKSKVDEEITSKLVDMIFRSTSSRNYSIFGFNGTNIAEGQEIYRWIRSLDGVKSVMLNIVEQVIHEYDWLEKELAMQASAPSLVEKRLQFPTAKRKPSLASGQKLFTVRK